VLIAQISDLHLLPDGAPWRGTVDTAALLRAAIARLNGLRPRPDLVVLSGDLADRGGAATYRVLRELLAGLELPYLLMPGNHDDGAALRIAFPEQDFVGDPLLCQHRQTAAGDLLLLDTTVFHRSHGRFDDAQHDWLQRSLRPGVPTLLFLHHPPFATGIGGMDGIALHHGDRLAGWLANQPNVCGLFCGHVHRPVFTQWAGKPVVIAPSTAHQIALDLDGPASGLRYTLEPPGLLLIRWFGAAPVVHVLPVARTVAVDYD
jgi:3',5'-cyclic AMP phosphodiesterase CpdA